MQGIAVWFMSYLVKFSHNMELIVSGTNNKKAPRGPTFKLGSVVVNVQSILKAEQDLEYLVKTIPTSKSERRK